MSTERACCAQRTQGAPHRSWFGAPLGLIALLFTPKCPLCVAAYLAMFGVGGAAAAALLVAVRSLGAAFALASVACLVLSWSRRRSRSKPPRTWSIL